MLFLNFIFGLLFLIQPHDYHVCITEIEYKEGKLLISQNLFTDDLEKALILAGHLVHIGDDLNEPALSEAIQVYIKSHFWITVDGQALPLNYIGTEWNDDYHSIYIYWEAKMPDYEVEEIEITNDVLLEVATDQQNMHHFKNSRKEKSLLLDQNNTIGNIQINN